MSKLRFIPFAVLTAGGMLAAIGAANAQSMYDINQRQDYQQNRIERGIYSGQITRSEAARLEQGERSIDGAQRRAMADGHVTSQERARIDRMTDRQGREIYQQSHDRQQAWDRGQDWGRTDGRAHNGWNDRDGWGRGGDNRGGWGQRDADRRDWGRGHNNGGWNHGRDHNGWDRSGNSGWNHSGNGGWNRGGDNSASNGGWNRNGNGGWNPTGTGGLNQGHANGGWNHNGNGSWNRGGDNGGWNRGGGGWNRGGSTGTGTTTPPATGGTAMASNTGMRGWGGQTRPVSASPSMSAPTRSYTTANAGAHSGGFGSGGRR